MIMRAEECRNFVILKYYTFTFYILASDGDPDPLWKQIVIHISGGLDSLLIFIKHILSVLKISKTFVFFLKTSSEYLTRYEQGFVFKIRFKNGSCLYFFVYSTDVFKKKTKILDIFYTDNFFLWKLIYNQVLQRYG